VEIPKALIDRVTRRLDVAGEDVALALPGVFLFRSFEVTELRPELYEPVICLVLQGQKETTFDGTTFTLSVGQSLLVSHNVPVLAQVTSATRAEPYVSIVLTIDVPLLRSLYDEVGEVLSAQPSSRSVALHPADPRVVDCLDRYIALAEDPVEARVLTPLIRRELHFRLLMAPHGGMLRELLRHDSHASHISRAIARIRRDFKAQLAVADLAREVGMSASSFHKHFREITSNTPLQYQKELRLIEARRMLTGGGHSVTSVAYEVGYGSPNQFSREYTRRFGVSPRAHLT